MKIAPTFLSLDQVKTIHQRMIDAFGGDAGIRDEGLLDSAVSMPAAQIDRTFLHQDIPTMAAAYFFHICKNHAFVDGNKRTALATADVFIELNGIVLEANNGALERLTVGVADGSLSKADAVAFFADHVVAGT